MVPNSQRVPNRRLAIMWTSADTIHWHTYAALGGHELNTVNFLQNRHKRHPKAHLWDVGWGVYSPCKGLIMWKAFACHEIIKINDNILLYCKKCHYLSLLQTSPFNSSWQSDILWHQRSWSTLVDLLSTRFSSIQFKVMLTLICKLCLRFTHLKLQPHPPLGSMAQHFTGSP